MSRVWAEAWRRPGDANFVRVFDDLPSTFFGLHDGLNIVGDGNMSLPDTFDGFDSLLLIDQVTPANSETSLIRYFSEEDPTTPIFEWLPRSIIPAQSKDDFTVEMTGRAIEFVLDYARLEPFDWDGTDDFISTFPDWIYGGPNVLLNPSFESENTQPIIYTLTLTGTAGNYTITDGTDTTSPIADTDNESTIETRLETDIAAITDVVVDPIDSGFTIEFKVPSIGITLSIASGGTVAELTLTQEGVRQPDPWTKSQQINVGTPKVFGVYDVFEVSDEQARTGDFSLKIDPGNVATDADRFAGCQQVVSVKPGGTYQASIWVYATSATNNFRFIIRTLGGKEIERDQQQNVAANTWVEFSIEDLVIPDGVTQLIFRFADITVVGSNPAAFYVDDGALNEGLAPSTLGKILGDLYDDATIDHAGRVVWEIGATGSPYLTLDFTDAVDSNGVAWIRDETAKLWLRMSYLQVMEQFVRSGGYEYRIVPNDVEAGTWLWQVYNPGTMKTDHTTAQSPAIQGGSSDVRRKINRFFPDGTDLLVEGLGRLTSRDRDANLISAIGRIESSRIDKELPSMEAIIDAAFEDSVDALTSGLSFGYTLVNPQDEPLSDYQIGDLLTVEDPPEVQDEGRFTEVTGSFTPTSAEWDVVFVPASEAGS